jgi:thiol-disulfide isomerase/thioredoxin
MNSTLKHVLTAIILILAVWGVRYVYLKPSARNGEKLPDLSGINRFGDSVRFSDFSGEYVLLHFWGSWCGSCRKENRDLKALFPEWSLERYGIEGSPLRIVSIGIEQSRDAWLKAIESDQLPWHDHLLADQLFDHEIPRAFGLKKIPTLFLIDPGGTIISADPGLYELEKLLRLRSNAN